MRSSFLVLGFALWGVGCSNDKCASTYSGHWVGTTQMDSLDFDTNCDFVFTGTDGCTSVGNYSDPLEVQGTVTIKIKAATPGCMATGDYSCSYTASASAFTYDCNNADSETFSR